LPIHAQNIASLSHYIVLLEQNKTGHTQTETERSRLPMAQQVYDTACTQMISLVLYTLKHFILIWRSLAPLATHYPSASDSIFDFGTL